LPFNATVVEASDLGLGAWTVDPASCIVSGSFVAATQYLASFFWKPDAASSAPFPTQVLVPNVVVGSWTLAQYGILCQDQVGANVPGTLLANTTAALPTAGIDSLTLTPVTGAPAVLPEGRYWLSLVVTGTTGTASSASNQGTDTAHMRFATNGTTVASITPSSNVAAGAGLFLVAAVR
jgi:hypothetical protein